MNLPRWLGLGAIALGLAFGLSFFTNPVNPSVSIINLGLLGVLLGVLILASDAYVKRVRLGRSSLILATAGWMVMSSGLLMWFYGFLLANQVACFCAESGPCSCVVPLYNLLVIGGESSAIVGGSLIVVGSFFSYREPNLAQAPLNTRLGSKGIAVAAILVTAATLFAIFSYWPGVDITSIYEVTQFPIGSSPPAGLMTIPMTQQGSLQIPIGGRFTYILTFKSLDSYSSYTVSKISIGSGFSITNVNASLPMEVSPSNSPVSIALGARGPYYPYYGPISFQITITK